MPSLCISIVTYQSDVQKLRAAIDSLHSINIDYHLVIADNASGKDYQSKLSEIVAAEIVRLPANKGFGAGHNAVREKFPAHDYLLVMNPDVVVHDGTIECMIKKMQENPDIGLLVPKVLNMDGTLQPLNKRLPRISDLFMRRFLPQKWQTKSWIKGRMDAYEMRDIGYKNSCEVPFASGCFMLIRGDVFDKVGGFDERYFMYLEDCDISRRIKAAGYRCYYDPEAMIYHHWARGSHRSVKLFLVMLHSMWVYFNQWGWRL